MNLFVPKLALLPLFALAACDGLQIDEPAPEDLAHLEAPISGYRSPLGVAGIVKISVAGQSDTHTGVLIGRSDIVITSARWLDFLTRPGDVTVRTMSPSGPVQARAGRFINTSWAGGSATPLSAVQVSAFTSGEGRSYAIDTRTSSALVGRALRCYEYVGDNLIYADMTVGRVEGSELVVAGNAQLGINLEDADAGAPCIDLQTGTVVGLASRVVAGEARVARLEPHRLWLDALPELNDTRDHWASSKASLYTRTSSGQRLCIDVPNGQAGDHVALNAFPCHYGPNQKFWLDYRAHTSQFRLVSESTGRCADQPGGLAQSGGDYQLYACHSGPNQRFELGLWQDQAGGLKLAPAHAPTLCLSVDPNTRRVEQRTCTGANDQRWYLAW